MPSPTSEANCRHLYVRSHVPELLTKVGSGASEDTEVIYLFNKVVVRANEVTEKGCLPISQESGEN